MKTSSRFDAEVLVRSENVIERGQHRMEFTLRDSEGALHVLSLPTIAAIALIPILSDSKTKAAYLPTQQPGLLRKVTHWSVGSAHEAPIVVLSLNDDPPWALHADEAKRLWRMLREEADAVSRRPSPPRM